jgi:hypothetical protein
MTTHCRKNDTKLLEKFDWENLDHRPYSPDLVPSDFQLFPKMKEFLGGKQMATDEEVKETVTDWLNGLAADVTRGLSRLSVLIKCKIQWHKNKAAVFIYSLIHLMAI